MAGRNGMETDMNGRGSLLGLACILLASACTAQHESPAPPAAAAANAAAASYPRCPGRAQRDAAHRCMDLFDALDPAEYSAKDFKAVALPLQDAGHTARALGLPGADMALADIVVHPSGRLYAVGGPGLLVASADADGENWHAMFHSEFADILHGIGFVDARRGFAVGENGKILRTLDGGGHWELFNRTFKDYEDPIYKDLHFDGSAYAVAFADAEHGAVAAEARLLRSADGGQQWQRVPLPLDGQALQQVRFVDARQGWAVGTGGHLLHSEDAGEHWSTATLGDGQTHLMDVSFADAAHGCAGGDFKLWCTQDAGRQWQEVELKLPKGMDASADVGITRIAMRDEHGWFITRDGWIFASSDGGKHWAPWMNVVAAAHGKLGGVELWGMALAGDRVWAVGAGNFAKQEAGSASLSNSPLILSWR
jgi:photosystem II stability/assembly factor-like uncharacterized protein